VFAHYRLIMLGWLLGEEDSGSSQRSGGCDHRIEDDGKRRYCSKCGMHWDFSDWEKTGAARVREPRPSESIWPF
jgi:hypothetical protein